MGGVKSGLSRWRRSFRIGTAAVGSMRRCRSDCADRGTGADVHHADSPVALGAMDFLALHDRCGEVTGQGAHGATRGGIDDSDEVAFQFCCVCHVCYVQ